MQKVSVIIPTYNRFKYVLNAVCAVKNQTYSNVEIIVVNDCSTEKDYYLFDWSKENVKIIHLEQNSKAVFGYACAASVRNAGMKEATGDWIAFCDDDDMWLPHKLELQLKNMNENDCKMSCTEGLLGFGVYEEDKKYLKYNNEAHLKTLHKIFKKAKKFKLISNGFPKIWKPELLKIHNLVICSSFIMHRDIYKMVGNMKTLKNGEEDYDCWLRCLNYGNILYVEEPCVYYDGGHGDGQNY
jgi:glycosyltransferase involved in cell wall biosynthesis